MTNGTPTPEEHPVCAACGHIGGYHLSNCRIKQLERDLAEARETNNRLNRRCQLAESAVAEKLGGHGPSFGRALLGAGYMKLRDANAALKVEHKNLHRIICEAAGYPHDECQYGRDQASLAEHVRTLKAEVVELKEINVTAHKVFAAESDKLAEIVTTLKAEVERYEKALDEINTLSLTLGNWTTGYLMAKIARAALAGEER